MTAGTAFTFKKATKTTAKARIVLMGPSGGGKTKTALLIAAGLVGPNGKIAVIDTENASASKYAGDDGVEFDVLVLESFAPTAYVQAIKAAEEAGYDAVIVDSLTHAWAGKGGALEQVDNAAKRSQSGNAYMAWRDVTPQHNALVDALVRCKCHLIATLRTKTDYVLEEVTKNGKTTKQPRRIGLAPVQREGMEYEFDVAADITLDHDLIVTKSRCSALDEAVIRKAGKELGRTLAAWLSDGAPAPEPAPEPEQKTPTLVDALKERKSAVDARAAAADRPDTRPARRIGVDVPAKPEPGVPVIGGKKHPKAGQPISALSDDEVIAYIRQMMHVAESPRWSAEMAPKIAEAKAWATAARGINDFSKRQQDRSEQLKAAVTGEEYNPELYLCVHPKWEGENILSWNSVEQCADYSAWLSAWVNPTQTARKLLVEKRIAWLAEQEAARVEAAMAATAAP
jgi:hypothetical protein